MKKILIIGGAGYIGTVLTAHLLEAGHAVRSLDLFLYQNDACVQSFLDHPRYESLRGDLCDSAQLQPALEGITDVILLAGLVGDPVTRKYPEASYAINQDGLRHCIDRLARYGLDRVIFVSTCSNYGLLHEDQLATEETELKPLSTYAEAKVQTEAHLLGKRGQVDYTPTVLRFATAFGLSPRMRFDLTINEFTRELFLEQPLLVYDSHTWRPYCHVADFASLISTVLKAPSSDVAFEVFNAGGEINNHTKQHIIDVILNHLSHARVSYQEHGSDPRNYRVDFQKVRQILGFVPSHTIDYGISELIQALSAGQFDDAENQPALHGNHQLQYPV